MLSYRSKDKLLLSLSAYLTFYLFIFNCHSLVFYIIFLYLHLFIYVSFCFSICLICLSFFLSIYTSLYILSTYQSVVLSIYLDIFLSICFSICLFIQLNIYLYLKHGHRLAVSQARRPPCQLTSTSGTTSRSSRQGFYFY